MHYSNSYFVKPTLTPATLEETASLLQAIPEDLAVCTDSYWVTYLASRRELYLTPVNIERCQIVVWDNEAALWYMPAAVRAKTAAYLAERFDVQTKTEQLTIYQRKSN